VRKHFALQQWATHEYAKNSRKTASSTFNVNPVTSTADMGPAAHGLGCDQRRGRVVWLTADVGSVPGPSQEGNDEVNVACRMSPHVVEAVNAGALLAKLEGSHLSGGTFTLTARDAILYAVAVGAGRQPAFAGAADLRRAADCFLWRILAD